MELKSDVCTQWSHGTIQSLTLLHAQDREVNVLGEAVE